MPRLAGHHIPGGSLALFSLEGVVLVAVSGAAWAGGAPGARDVGFVLACAVAVQVALYWVDLYDVRVAHADSRSGRRLCAALGAAALAGAPLALALPADARSHVPRTLAAVVIAAAAVRATAPWRRLRRRVFIVGNGEAPRLLRRELDGDEIIVGQAQTGAEVTATIRATRPDLVVVACDERRGVPPTGLLELRLGGTEVLDAVSYIERTRRKVPLPLLRPATLIYDQGFERSRASRAARRALSVGAALVLCALTLPIWLVCALAIRLDTRGPIFYRQRRVGRRGRVFSMWKFRTMHVGAESDGVRWASENDPRVTRVGAKLRRYRLDELPQLLNVLTGDMDVVGPRPERPEFVDSLVSQVPFYDVRALVRPGITGWAQIRYRYGASVEDAREKLGYDLYYVKHASLLLDLIVLFHTAKVVLGGRGAR